MATLYSVDGKVVDVQPKVGNSFSLEELQAFVGGYIEHVRVGPDHMIVNEEGKMYNMPINRKATEIFQHWHSHFDVIVGNALLLTTKEMGD